jgi:hypothetical protein
MARRWIDQRWLRFGLALGVSAAAEIAVELAEYPLLYSGRLHATAYYDTIADMASTIVGALVGAAVVVVALGTGAARRRYGP